MKRVMRKIAVFFIWFIISIYIAVAMLPKSELYYQAEHLLKKHNVYLSDETTSDKLFFFDVDNANIIYTDIDAAHIDKIAVSTFVFYNSINVSPFSVKNSLSGFIPPKVEFIRIKNFIWRPHIITLESEGDFGKASGFIDLLNRRVHIDFVFSSVINIKYSQLLRVLNKTKEGYMYESSF